MEQEKITYTFSEGTRQIKAADMEKALLNYDGIVIPGSVENVRIDTSKISQPIRAAEIILNEGVRTLNIYSDKRIVFNMPTTLLKIKTRGEAYPNSNVLCLPSGFQELDIIGGVEYLQAWDSCSVGPVYLPRRIKHYVLLGNKLSLKRFAFWGCPKGMVLHVESNKVALSILKKWKREFDCANNWYGYRMDVSLFNAVVVPDADEWKDFPKDKLSLTLEEYNAESRVLPKQQMLRKEALEFLNPKIRARKEKERDLQENKGYYTFEKEFLDVVNPALKPLNVSYKLEVLGGKKNWNKYKSCRLSTILLSKKESGWNNDLKFEVILHKENLVANVDQIVAVVQDLVCFHRSNNETIRKYDIGYSFGTERKKLLKAIGEKADELCDKWEYDIKDLLLGDDEDAQPKQDVPQHEIDGELLRLSLLTTSIQKLTERYFDYNVKVNKTTIGTVCDLFEKQLADSPTDFFTCLLPHECSISFKTSQDSKNDDLATIKKFALRLCSLLDDVNKVNGKLT